MREALASDPCQHCAVTAIPMALTALQCLCTSHFLDNPVSIVPWTSQLSLCWQHSLCRQAPLLNDGCSHPLCSARAVHGLFCFYSSGVKLKQPIKQKLCCPIYTNQWSGLHPSQDSPNSEAISKVKNVWAASSPCWTLTTPLLASSPTSAFWAKTAEAGGRGRRVKQSGKPTVGTTWGCERAWWLS